MSQSGTKLFALRMKSSAAPSENQLAAIRSFTLRDFAAEELVVREFVLAHNAIDRDGEVFDENLLADFQRTIPGKGTYINHPTSYRSEGGPAEGRVFGARLERMSFDRAREVLREPSLKFPPDRSEAVLLYTEAFFAKTDENSALLTKMDAGIVGDISIGFSAADLVAIRDAEGRELNSRRWVGPGEAHEQSLVWLGAQPGARATKSKSENAVDTITKTDHERILAAQKAESDAFKQRAETAEKAAAPLTALKAALGDDVALLDSPAQLASMIKSGQAFRKGLVDDIVAHERHLKLTGDTEEAVKAARDLYDGMPTEKLEAMQKHLQARIPRGTTITGGEPGAKAPGTPAHETDDSKAAGPFGSELLA